MNRLPKRNTLAEVRARRGLTHQQVADAAGISRAFYTRIESGIRTPSLDVALRIAEVLDADPRELFADVLDEHATAESA